MDFSISKYLDNRRAINTDETTFPVKIRVYSKIVKRAKLYSTSISLSNADFVQIFDPNARLRGKKKEILLYLNEFEQRAYNVAKELHPFTFDSFEKKLFRNKKASISIKYHYSEKIKELQSNDQITTASNYDLSLKSIGMFLLKKTKFNNLDEKEEEIGIAVKNLTFYDITKDWLVKYENFMVAINNKSYTTVSMYLRCLRTIFNQAMEENDINKEIYPFGKSNGKYQIPSAQKKKKALTSDQLQLLFNTEPSHPDHQKAKDFWFLSFALSGINIKDLCLLKFKDMTKDTIEYYREKTVSTKKTNLKKITVYLNDYSRSIIDKYSNDYHNENTYIFSIIDEYDSAFEKRRKIKNFISYINLHFNKFASSIGFDFKISIQWARHSFATNAIRKGATMEFVSEALNHSNLNVTKQYFAGFEDKTKKDFAANLMKF